MALASSISIELATTTVIGYYGGSWLDRHFHTSPWLMIICIFLGLAAGMWGMYQTLEAFRKREKG